ncbi:hypothetical protein EV426DRAFT_573111 [Tirmania nivea]|nr:hypothetical protein EV426DRAFT_573111 [Tirmania nivea]
MAESGASPNDPRPPEKPSLKRVLTQFLGDPQIIHINFGIYVAAVIINTVQAYIKAPSAMDSGISELGEVTNILLKLETAGPHLPAALKQRLEPILVEFQETTLRLLKALRPYSGGEGNKKPSERQLHRLRWAMLDSENIKSILKTLTPQKRALELIIAIIETLSPTAFTNEQTPPVGGSIVTTTFENFSSLSIKSLYPDGLSEEDIEWINTLSGLSETTTPDGDQEAEVQSTGDAESVEDAASFFHSAYSRSIARSDNASHIYSETSSQLGDESSIRSATSRTSTDTFRRSSSSLFTLPNLRRNTGSAAGDFPTYATSSRSPNRSMTSLRSIMHWRKPTVAVPEVPPTETLSAPTEAPRLDLMIESVNLTDGTQFLLSCPQSHQVPSMESANPNTL